MLLMHEGINNIYKELFNKLVSLNDIARGLYDLTEVLLDYASKNELIYFCDNEELRIRLDYHDIKDETWYRSVNEIKEILYRSDSSRFSIHQALIQLGLRINDDSLNDQSYLKLLYILYVINYFAFPHKNIFKLLKKENVSYQYAYDDGLKQNDYLYLIMHCLLDDYYIKQFMIKLNELNYVMNGLDNNEEDYIMMMLEYCHTYAMYGYCNDLMFNLKQWDCSFEDIRVPPYNIWKDCYVSIDEIDEFVMSKECYCFVKNEWSKPAYRECLKLKESNAVGFLKRLIEYDIKWYKDFNDYLLLEQRNTQLCIYALRLAVILRTYYWLVVKNGYQLKTMHYSNQTSIKALLMSEESMASIGIRFFLLVAHDYYEYIIGKDMYHLNNEYIYLEHLRNAYSYSSLYEVKQYMLGSIK